MYNFRRPDLIKTEPTGDLSDAENEVFLFNESSFVNLFESSKFNSIVSDKNFTSLVEDSVKSFRLLDSDEDFYSELNEDNLKLLEMNDLELNSYDDALLDSSVYSSPRYNSLFNSLASMDSHTKEIIKDTDSIYGIENDVFFEDEKLINESLIESCTLTEEQDFKSSYSNISEALSSSSFEHITNSPPLQANRKRKLTETSRFEQSKPKKFLPKFDRNRNARRFYNRSRTSSKKIQISTFNDTILKKMTKNLKLGSYKPSNKVEKLLNDSRGMRKYLIDYDGMMPEPRPLTNLTYASLLNITFNNTSQSNTTVYKSSSSLSNCLRSISCTTRLDRYASMKLRKNRPQNRHTSVSYSKTITGNQLACNRASSGYLTDC